MSEAAGDDPKYDYEHEPRRIRKGAPWARTFFKKVFGFSSARERRIDEGSHDD
jgi:hypothetical protein